MALKGTVVKSADWEWNLFGSYTKNKNKVVSLIPGVDQFAIGGLSGMSIVAAVGKPYGEFYGVTRFKDSQGRTVVDESTGLPLNTSKAEYLGNYNPKYQASWGTSVNYKQLVLYVLFDTKQGRKCYSRTRGTLAFVCASEETGGNRFGEIWTNSVYQDVSGNYVPNTSVGYVKQNYYGGSLPAGFNIVDGSFIKLCSASLSYAFNKSQLKSLPVSSLTLDVFGNNLFMWTASENKFADPEVNSAGATNVQGFDFTAQPSVRNYGINLKVSF